MKESTTIHHYSCDNEPCGSWQKAPSDQDAVSAGWRCMDGKWHCFFCARHVDLLRHVLTLQRRIVALEQAAGVFPSNVVPLKN